MRKWREIAGTKPTIFLGNFNLLPTTYTHELFCGKKGPVDLQGRFVDCWQALGKSEYGAGTVHGFNGNKNSKRIDWILATPEFKIMNTEIIYYNKNGRYPSDCLWYGDSCLSR